VKRLLIACVAAAAVAAVGVVAYGVLGPDPAKQAQADGCSRSRTAEFSRLAPGWVYVGDEDVPAASPPPAPRWLAGVVQAFENGPDAVHPSGGDDPTTHDAFDLNFNVKPDPAYEELLGGLPEADTGNFEGEGEERDRIHPERELTAIPAWSWPEAGDHVQVMGSWVWDCGHWDPGGERTEIHPYRALWDERVPSPRSPYGESEGSLFVSTDATPAGQAAECAHRTKMDGDAYKACTRTQPNWLDVSGDYVLTLKAPPKPFGATALRVRVVDRGSTVDPHWTTTVANGTLTLRFRLASSPGVRLVLAKQVFFGWRRVTPAALPVHLRVTFTRLLTRRAMDPGCPNSQHGCGTPESVRDDQISTAPGEWLVYTDVAGTWTQWPLLRAKDREVFAVQKTTDVYLRPGQAWRLFVFTHECDFGTGSWTDPAKPMAPCPATKEFGNFVGDDVPGEILVRYRGAGAIGAHVSDGSLAPPSTCPASNKQGCYRLWWSVTRVRDERLRASRLR
jgi:hypothetical protein